MKKILLGLFVLGTVFWGAPARAFIPLPPFKMDAGGIGNEVISYGNTTSQTAGKGLQQSAIVQTAITYGKGAKEFYDFGMKMMKEFQGIELNNLGEIMNKLSDMEAEQSKTKEDAAVEIAAKTREANAKIAALDENTRELNKKIVEDPANTEKYQKQIRKNEQEKAKISKKLVKETRQINRKTETKIGKLNDQIGNMKNQAADLIASVKMIPANYDSAEDLQKTAKSLMPEKGTEVDTHVSATYAAIYRAAYYKAMQQAMVRSMTIKSRIEKDDTEAGKKKVSTVQFESLGGALGTVVTMKTDNIQALLNFTEILLQKMQLDVARDLATENFATVDPVQAAGDFNLDNYKFTPPSAEELEAADGKKPEKLGELEKEITPSSGKVLTDGLANMQADAESGDNPANTTTEAGSGKDEKK